MYEFFETQLQELKGDPIRTKVEYMVEQPRYGFTSRRPVLNSFKILPESIYKLSAKFTFVRYTGPHHSIPVFKPKEK